MRAVIDTNVLISGLLWRGPPHALLAQVRTGAISLICSPALLAEFGDALRRPKFAPILNRSHDDPEHLLTVLRQLVEIIDPPPLPNPVCRDPGDDAMLALAAASRADIIVSGGDDLLSLGAFADIPTASPVTALRNSFVDPG